MEIEVQNFSIEDIDHMRSHQRRKFLRTRPALKQMYDKAKALELAKYKEDCESGKQHNSGVAREISDDNADTG